jgi:hypothetical protein
MKYMQYRNIVYRRDIIFPAGTEAESAAILSDADHGMCLDSYRSKSGQLFLLNGAAIYWKSQLQISAAISTTEAEFITLSENAYTVFGLRILMNGLNEPPPCPTIIYQDNTATIAASKNAPSCSRLRHVNVRVYNIRDLIRAGDVYPILCDTTDQHADLRLCIKALTAIPFTRHTNVAHCTLSTDPPLFPMPVPGPA